MNKEEYPKKIYASKYVNRHEGDPYGDFYLENENELCTEYVRADIVLHWHDASKELPEDCDDVIAIVDGRVFRAMFRRHKRECSFNELIADEKGLIEDGEVFLFDCYEELKVPVYWTEIPGNYYKH